MRFWLRTVSCGVVLLFSFFSLFTCRSYAEERPPRPQPRPAQPQWPRTADDHSVTFSLFEAAGDPKKFPIEEREEAFRFTTPALAIHRLPLKYTAGGVRQAWTGPLLMRAFVKIMLPEGEHELLVRSPGLSRLWIDGSQVTQTAPRRLFPDAHQPFIVYQPDLPWLRVPFVGDREVRVRFQATGNLQEVVLESLVGSDKSRCEVGETLVAARSVDTEHANPAFSLNPNAGVKSPEEGWHSQSMFKLLTPAGDETEQSAAIYLVDSEFEIYRKHLNVHLDRIDRQSLEEESAKEDEFWHQRHQWAAEFIAGLPAVKVPQPSSTLQANNAIDHFINAALPTAALPDTADPSPAAIDASMGDLDFLRRLSLDTVGVPPALHEIESYLSWQQPNGAVEPENSETLSLDRRQRAIEQLLADDRWADHWVSYWQDVLAENPNILKPKLNNTGPFRWWLYDALVLNKPMDRFVTELIRMEGSPYAGAAAGFSWATENDVPMAEKAHIIAGAFLSVDLKCARCHDAPYHPWSQKDLFSLGAMLENKAITVPATSSVPRTFFDLKGDDAPIAVTLQPGEVVAPAWPTESLRMDRITHPQSSSSSASALIRASLGFGNEAIDPQLFGRPASSREELAARITRAQNRRFAATLVNRLWTRLLGWGLMEDTDDWYEAEIRHPELLDYLSRELVTSGYDLKHVAKLIFSSRTYQRRAIDETHVERAVAFSAPWRHRLSAEQVVDSLHHVAGVAMDTEAITFDPEASQRIENFLNLGEARRAWQLTSLSNERDRPSLSLPKAATIVECLEAFGWRQSRQSPLTHREVEANLVQPGVVANGTLAGSLTRLTDESTATALALASDTPEQFIEQLFMTVLTRQPSGSERQTFVEQLAVGFRSRSQDPLRTVKPPPVSRGFATWSNHFATEANALMRDIELEVAAGPEPTQRLTVDWRERAEDAIWALVNSPEFQFVP